MLKKLKLLKKPLFQNRRWSCDFPPRKTRVAQKHRVISHQEKMAFSTPVGLSWDSPPPPRVCADGRTYRCTDVRTDGHVTITSQPKFLGLIGNQISLAMELRWRALPAGSAIRTSSFVVEAEAKVDGFFFLDVLSVKHRRFKCNDLSSVSLFTVVVFSQRIHIITLPQLRMTRR